MTSVPPLPGTAAAAVGQVDVRGPRFGAWVTTLVLAVALVTGSGPRLRAARPARAGAAVRPACARDGRDGGSFPLAPWASC